MEVQGAITIHMKAFEKFIIACLMYVCCILLLCMCLLQVDNLKPFEKVAYY